MESCLTAFRWSSKGRIPTSDLVVLRRIALAALAAVLLLAPPAAAFDSKGHVVVEALAYRTLVEGHDGQAPRPEVLRDLINDGALDAPFCFGRGDTPPKECVDAAASNPLLDWPQPLTDRPDAAFRRQFSDVGQCFHYMATLDDAQTDPLPGTSVPRALATSAVVRCNDLLDGLLRQVVVIGGLATRRSSHGLYEFMHAVGDSFSGSHTERAEDGRIGYLRVWQPIEKLVKLPTERSQRIPATAYHKWDDHRDKTYVIEGGEAACEKRTDQPYNVPYECLSPEGDRARRALVELLVLARDLRVAQLAVPKGTDTAPERSDAWREYKAKWFAPAHPCEGAECAEREQSDPPPGRYAFYGLDTSWNPTGHFVDIAARGMLMKYSEDLNPFLYALNANVGYRQYTDGGGGAGLVGLGFDLVLPVGLRATLGFTPAGLRVTYGGDRAGPELVSRFLRFNYKLKEGLFLSVDAPLEVNWLKPRVEWTFGVGLIYAPPSSRLSKDRGLLLQTETLADPPGRRVGAAARALRAHPRPDAFVVRRYGRDRRGPARKRRRGAQLRARPPRRRGRVGSEPLGRPVRVGSGRVARRRPPGDLRRVEVPHGHVRRHRSLVRAQGPRARADARAGRVRAEGPRGRRKSTRRRASAGVRGASTTSRPARASASFSTPGSSTSSSKARRSRGTPLRSRRRKSSASGSASG